MSLGSIIAPVTFFLLLFLLLMTMMLTIYDPLQFFAHVRCSHAENLK